MMSSQRILLILFIMNLAIGIANEMYISTENFTVDEIDTDVINLENVESEAESDSGVWGAIKATSGTFESSPGNPLKWGYQIIKIFIRGINPFGMQANDFNTDVEKAIVSILTLFRAIMATIAVVELYMIIKNKKTS